MTFQGPETHLDSQGVLKNIVLGTKDIKIRPLWPVLALSAPFYLSQEVRQFWPSKCEIRPQWSDFDVLCTQNTIFGYALSIYMGFRALALKT